MCVVKASFMIGVTMIIPLIFPTPSALRHAGPRFWQRTPKHHTLHVFLQHQRTRKPLLNLLAFFWQWSTLAVFWDVQLDTMGKWCRAFLFMVFHRKKNLEKNGSVTFIAMDLLRPNTAKCAHYISAHPTSKNIVETLTRSVKRHVVLL